MTAINRTAYPRLDARLNHEELDARYTLNEAEHAFTRARTRGEWGRLTMAMLLKTRQDFGCFPALEEMHLLSARSKILHGSARAATSLDPQVVVHGDDDLLKLKYRWVVWIEEWPSDNLI